jgi:hypothetical protein
MNIGPLVQNLYAAPPQGRLPGAAEENGARLLELRTDAGLLYVRPSGWQRIWLLWTFRHFHVLPQQLLSRRDQRLIETLSYSARVTPSLPVHRSTVFGVVENVRTKPQPAGVFFAEPAKPAIQEGPVPVREARFLQWWGALGIAISVCLILILARIYGGHTGKSPAVSAPTVHAAVRVPAPTLPAPAAVPPAPTLVARKSASPAPPIVDPEPAAAPVESIAPAGDGQRMFVAELPQGHLVQPVLSDSNLTGELQLRALIATDGSVEDVTVVSGNPKLAPAAIRAVRRWHYAGLQGEAEALIRMNFFGQDAVSITSVAR